MHLSPDFVVIGSGIAGLRAAIALAPVGPRADPHEGRADRKQHRLRAGRHRRRARRRRQPRAPCRGHGEGRRRAVRRRRPCACSSSRARRTCTELVEWGTRFDRDADGRLVARARGGAQRPARAACGRRDGTRDRARAVEARQRAADGRNGEPRAGHRAARRGRPRAPASGSSISSGFRATRGRGPRCWPPAAPGRSSRKPRTRPSRPATAWRSRFMPGARVADLEFVQFHPTALNVPGAPRFLISEALRGDGARLINGRGEAFMTRYHPDGDLAPRDVVARSIVREMEQTGGPVFLSLVAPRPGLRRPPVSDDRRHVPPDRPRPGHRSDSRRSGRALHHGRRRDRSVGPDVDARAVRGRRGGLHGRPRRQPARQQLAARGPRVRRARGARHAAAAGGAGGRWQWIGLAAASASGSRTPVIDAGHGATGPPATDHQRSPRPDVEVRRPVPNAARACADAVAKLEAAYVAHRRALDDARADDADAWKQFNLVTVARLIARAALRRQESRGAHYRAGFSGKGRCTLESPLVDHIDTYGEKRQD